MKISFLVPVLTGIFLAATLSVSAIIMLTVFSALCACESRRLRKSSQLTDWHWEHDLVSIKRTAFNFRSGSVVSFQRPRKFYGFR